MRNFSETAGPPFTQLRVGRVGRALDVCTDIAAVATLALAVAAWWLLLYPTPRPDVVLPAPKIALRALAGCAGGDR